METRTGNLWFRDVLFGGVGKKMYFCGRNSAFIYNLNMESKECAIVAYADAIDVAVADKLLAVGDVFNVFGILDLYAKPVFKIIFFLLVQNDMPFGTLLAELGIKL